MKSNTPSFYEALSHPPVRAAGNEVDLTIYRGFGDTTYGKFEYQAPYQGLCQVGGPQSTETEWSDQFEIAWTKVGNKGPLLLLLHGVPCNRAQWEEVQRFLGRYCETIAIDMLGMLQARNSSTRSRPRTRSSSDLARSYRARYFSKSRMTECLWLSTFRCHCPCRRASRP